MKKRPFSILEVLMAFGIIVLLGTAVALNFKEGADKRREQESVDIVKTKLRFASQLAKMTNNVVEVELIERDGNHFIFVVPTIKTSDAMKKNLSKEIPLAHVKEVQLIPNSTKRIIVEYFPWGIHNQRLELKLIFSSGNTISILPREFAPQVLVQDNGVIEALFPREIIEDEKE